MTSSGERSRLKKQIQGVRAGTNDMKPLAGIRSVQDTVRLEKAVERKEAWRRSAFNAESRSPRGSVFPLPGLLGVK